MKDELEQFSYSQKTIVNLVSPKLVDFVQRCYHIGNWLERNDTVIIFRPT